MFILRNIWHEPNKLPSYYSWEFQERFPGIPNQTCFKKILGNDILGNRILKHMIPGNGDSNRETNLHSTP